MAQASQNETVDRWVNAVIQITIPMDDVSVDASKWEKQEAAGEMLMRVLDALPEDLAQHVASGYWEDVSDA